MPHKKPPHQTIIKPPSSRKGLDINAPATSNAAGRHDLYPPASPFSSGFLNVDALHSLYWEQSGNPDGVPIVVLHGGPGGGASTVHRRLFDPAHYRIIIFDQRGSGRSTPLGCLQDNTPDLLRSDMEMLRKHLRIKKWHIIGESWGSTLALLYASKHPDRCISLILRGIFLMEQDEIDWFLYGTQRIFPDYWDQFTRHIPANERADLLNAYYNRLVSQDTQTQLNAGIQWALYENACSTLLPRHGNFLQKDKQAQALALARIEAHYFKHHIVAKENSILTKIEPLRQIPSVIIQGRYDIICPIKTAYRLSQAWPEADFVIVPDGGHSALDPAIRSRIIQATNNARTIIT